MSREQVVTLQLYRRGRRVGPECSARLDWREHAKELHAHMTAALDREGVHASRIGEYEMVVREARTDRIETTFVAVGGH